MAMSQSRNPRFHSNGVLKLGRVSRSLHYSEGNTQGGTTFCLVSRCRTRPLRARQTPVYNMLEK